MYMVPRAYPDRVADLKARSIPSSIHAARAVIARTSENVHRMSLLMAVGEMPADARRAVAARVAQHLSVLAAYNPGLIASLYGGAL